ncbi:MAG: hypothetical protein ACK5MQ_07845 [Pikeienuella sp.]
MVWFRRLLFVGISFFLILISLAVAGERLLPLFHGDRDLAGRAMKAIFISLGGLGFAFAQPALWGAYARHAQGLIARGGARGPMARWIRCPGFPRAITNISIGAMAVFALVSLGLSWAVWTGSA